MNIKNKVFKIIYISVFFLPLCIFAQSSSFTFKQTKYSVEEGASVRVTVVAPANLSKTTRVPVRIQSGTARSGVDYISPTNVTLTFYKGGLKEKSILIRTKTDTAQENTESFTVRGTGITGTATVQITNKGAVANQSVPTVCPEPYIALESNNPGTFTITKPRLIQRSYSYIPWGPAAAFGQGAPGFPAYNSSVYGAMRPANDPAVVAIGSVEAYEFTGPTKTWSGGEHDVAYYTAEAMDFPPGTSYEARKGKAPISDGEVQIAVSPQGGTGNVPGTFAMSIDKCPGVIDPRRDVSGRRCTTVGSESSIAWTTPGAQYGFGGPNDIYNGVRVPSQYPYVSLSDKSCLLETGKKYYLNISAIRIGDPAPGVVPEIGNIGIRMVNRSSARISP